MQTTLNEFFERVESASNEIQDKLAIIYNEMTGFGTEVQNLAIKFSLFICRMTTQFESIRAELESLKEKSKQTGEQNGEPY